MNKYKKQLERLKRHYQASINHYDPISLLDLAHTLRVWTELKDGVDNVWSQPTFKKAILTRSMKKILTGAEYAYAYFPDGLTTSAAATAEVSGRIMVHGPMADKFTSSISAKIEKNRHLTIYRFLIIYRALSQKEIKIEYDESKNVPIENVGFLKYMTSNAIFFKFSGHAPRQVSNEELIKRIANEYEASHADISVTNFDLNNVFSEPIKRLMAYECARLPLPYFVLLHIAKNIIENFEGHF